MVKDKARKVSQFVFEIYESVEKDSDGISKQYVSIIVSNGMDKISGKFLVDYIEFDETLKGLKRLYDVLPLLLNESSKKEVGREALVVLGKLLYLLWRRANL